MTTNNTLSIFGWAAFFSLLSVSLLAAPQAPQGYYYPDQQTTALRELRDSVESIKHAINNQETEIRTFDEKLSNLDTIIESVRDQVSENSRSHKDLVKNNTAALETKITTLESNSKGIQADLKQFQNYTAENSNTLSQYKKKINELEKTIEVQNQNIDDMQAAIKALSEAILLKSPPLRPMDPPKAVTQPPEVSDNTYRVKEGDTLEKIARAQQTSVKAIKELNNLANDTIFVGKILKTR